MKNHKLWILVLSVILLNGCSGSLSPQSKQGIHEAASTEKARSENFEAVKEKITSKDPKDQELIEKWKIYHSYGLSSEAKALSDLDTEINGNNAVFLPALPEKGK